MRKINIIMIASILFSITFLYLANRKYSSPESILQNMQLAYYQLAASFTNHPDDLANLGTFYLTNGQPDLAEKYLLKAHEMGSRTAATTLGFLYGNQGKLDLAETYLRLAVKQSDHPKSHLALAALYMRQKKFDLALPYCISAAEKGNPIALVGLGLIYEGQHNFELAEQCFSKALEIKEKIPAELLSITYKGLGMASLIKGAIEPAKDYFRLSDSETSKQMLNLIDKLESNELTETEIDELKANPKLIEKYLNPNHTSSSKSVVGC